MKINNERLLKTFLEYVQIDSETGFEKDMANRLEADLKAMGLNAMQDTCGTVAKSTGNNVYCFIEGDSSLEPLLFCAHMDTVTPGNGIKPIIENGVIKTDGTTILGGDDKSGIAAIMESLKIIVDGNIAHRPIEILFTVREESGMHGVNNFDSSTLKSKMGVVLDSGGEIGTLIVTAPGQLKINAEIIGKSSHAGVSPEAGISAIQVAGHAISNMKLLRIDSETTANIGSINATYPTNIVPEKVMINAEARSINYDKLVAQGDHMRKCFEDACEKFGATVNCSVETSYIGYETDEKSPILAILREKCEGLGYPVVTKPTGGGSDANVLRKKGIEVMNVSTGMAKVHSKNEEIKVSDLEKIGALVLELMKK